MRHMANTKAAMATVAAMCAVVGVLGGIGMAQGPATSHPATAPAPPTAALPATSSAVMLEKGIYTEETVGDLDAAIKIYQQIVEDAKAARKYAAQAQYRLGMCHLKKGDKAKATAELRELLALYPQEKEIAAQAQKELAKLEPLEEEITKLRRRGTTTEDVIRVLGEPEKLIWGRQTFTKDNLPETYILQYPKGLHVMVSYGLAVEFRSEQPGPGFTYRGKLRLGSPLKDVLDVLGEPSHTVVGEPIGFVTGCLYNDFDGKKGYSYYSRADQGVRVFLLNDKVSALYLTADGDRQEFLPAAKAAPLVVKTTPAALADNVDPSLGKMTVTFDRPMIDKSWSWTGGGETYPEAAGKISYDANRTTCTMPVKLQPGKVYWVGVNSPSHRNFKTPDRVPAKWYIILFATRSADGKPKPLPADMLKRAKAINAAAATQQAEPSEQVKRDAENLSAEGWALWNQRKLPEAEAKFKAAVEKDPTNANAWNGLGWAQMNQGKVLNAKDAFEKAVAADPKLAGALNGLGWIAKGQGKTDEAMRFWRQAVEALPSATAALSGLASTLYEQGQYEKAVEHYQAMLKIEPDSAEAKAGLAKAEMARQAIAAAAPVAQAWITLVDEGKIAESWEQSSKLFQTGIAKDKWGAVLKSAREPLGKLQSRKLISATYMTSVPGAPDGQYLVVQFEAVFENKRQAVETVTPMKGKDGKWRVSGYYIK